MLASWAVMFVFQYYYLGYIVGIILLDIGMQCIQICNQTCALSLNQHASNRVNTIFMTTYFIGGSFGTFLSGAMWDFSGWAGTVMAGVSLVVLSLFITLFTKD